MAKKKTGKGATRKMIVRGDAMRMIERPDGSFVGVYDADKLTERMQIRLSKTDVQQLRQAAKASGLSVSEVIRLGIPLAFHELCVAKEQDG